MGLSLLLELREQRRGVQLGFLGWQEGKGGAGDALPRGRARFGECLLLAWL